jgi:hypothetical protein
VNWDSEAKIGAAFVIVAFILAALAVWSWW